MALRKIYIAVDCVDDAQKERVQAIAEELSSMRVFDGSMIVSVYPSLAAKKGELYEIVKYLQANGAQGVKSFKFAGMVSKLML